MSNLSFVIYFGYLVLELLIKKGHVRRTSISFFDHQEKTTKHVNLDCELARHELYMTT